MELQGLIARSDISVMDCMKLIDSNARGIAFIVDEENRLTGTVTDGDIRRFILSGNSIHESVAKVMNKKPVVVHKEMTQDQIKDIFLKRKAGQLPVLDGANRVIGVISLNEFFMATFNEHPVVIMAGGVGTRLRPLTDEMPKPMLKIGDKPLLEILINSFKKYGYKNIILCVNYKSELIKNYFQNGESLGVHITYIEEKDALGTGGAVRLAQKYINSHFFVVNGDILTNMNFDRMRMVHEGGPYDLTVATKSIEIQVPYGVLSTTVDMITAIEEKPAYSFSINGGVYMMSKKVIQHIPENTPFDMTDLIHLLIKQNYKVGSYTIDGYWMDIGQLSDYYKANADVESFSL